MAMTRMSPNEQWKTALLNMRLTVRSAKAQFHATLTTMEAAASLARIQLEAIEIPVVASSSRADSLVGIYNCTMSDLKALEEVLERCSAIDAETREADRFKPSGPLRLPVIHDQRRFRAAICEDIPFTTKVNSDGTVSTSPADPPRRQFDKDVLRVQLDCNQQRDQNLQMISRTVTIIPSASGTSSDEEDSNSSRREHCMIQSNALALMPTARIKLRAHDGSSKLFTAILDTGSTISCISKYAASVLELPTKRENVDLFHVNDKKERTTLEALQTEVRSSHDHSDWSHHETFYVHDVIIRKYPFKTLDTTAWTHLHGIPKEELASEHYMLISQVDVLLGVGPSTHAFSCHGGKEWIIGNPQQPRAMPSAFGYVIMGCMTNPSAGLQVCSHTGRYWNEPKVRTSEPQQEQTPIRSQLTVVLPQYLADFVGQRRREQASTAVASGSQQQTMKTGSQQAVALPPYQGTTLAHLLGHHTQDEESTTATSRSQQQCKQEEDDVQLVYSSFFTQVYSWNTTTIPPTGWVNLKNGITTGAARALFDSGSSINLISDHLVNRLRLKRKEKYISVKGVNHMSTG